ncbi:terpenoid cyclases/protein prenyltransferase alpha-alpha toroid [Entophlyctis helioformis]|nr:terpenoid cyclases/protein prenyltransferase alpha-alpha toroid [Entophlyctis helioformis]
MLCRCAPLAGYACWLLTLWYCYGTLAVLPVKMADLPDERGIDAKYFAKNLRLLPHLYLAGDTNRMTLGYFCIGGLDLLGALDANITPDQKRAWIDWIYAQQVHPSDKFPAGSGLCGFRGSPFSGAPHDPQHSTAVHEGDGGHLTMTYTALVLLLMLGDDLARVNADAIVTSMRCLQSEDGCFSPTVGSDERDMRFLYCACVVSYLLSDWRGMDKAKALAYIKASRAFDFGYGQGPGRESHGGSTYCAIASLWLMGLVDEGVENKDRTIAWLLSRQESGFQGRINKPPDTCYAFWVGAALEMLDAYKSFVDTDAVKAFMATTHSSYGGYGKLPGAYPDVMHSYMGFAGLAIAGASGLPKIVVALGITCTVFDFWKTLSTGKAV